MTRFSPQPQTTPRLFLARYPVYLAVVTVLLALLLHSAIAGAAERDLVLEPCRYADGTPPIAIADRAAGRVTPILIIPSVIDRWDAEHAVRLRPLITDKPIGAEEVMAQPTAPPTVALYAPAEERKRDLATEPYLRADETVPIVAFASAVDLWSTEHAFRLRPTLVEKNIAGQNMGERAALQFAHVGAHMMLAHVLDRRLGRKWGRVALYGIAAGKVAVAANNYRLGKRGFQ